MFVFPMFFLCFQSEGGVSEKEQSDSSTSQNLDLGFPDDDDEPNNPEGTALGNVWAKSWHYDTFRPP